MQKGVVMSSRGSIFLCLKDLSWPLEEMTKPLLSRK